MKYKAKVIESVRGHGQTELHSLEFDTEQERDDFIYNYNVVNLVDCSEFVPDRYRMAITSDY